MMWPVLWLEYNHRDGWERAGQHAAGLPLTRGQHLATFEAQGLVLAAKEEGKADHEENFHRTSVPPEGTFTTLVTAQRCTVQ